MIDGRHITYYEDDEATNLSTEQQRLLQKHREIVEARKKEQEAQKAEAERLDEILRICEEYAKQQVGGGVVGAADVAAAVQGVTDGSVDSDLADKPAENTKQLSKPSNEPKSPQSPPPLNRPGRKAYGLGLLCNASVEASKELQRTGMALFVHHQSGAVAPESSCLCTVTETKLISSCERYI